MVDTRTIANGEAGSSVRAKLNFDRTSLFNAQEFGWLPDDTNRSAEALALLAAVVAEGGGEIFFPASTGKYRADSQLIIPNDAASPQPAQVNIRLRGSGGGANWYSNVGRLLGSVLDLRYQGSNGGKLETRGLGTLALDGIGITDGGAVNGTPLVHSSNTVLLVQNCDFNGGGGKTATVTMTIASPCVVTWNGHLLQANSSFYFTNSGGALPTGAVAGKLYYVSAAGLTANTFQFSINSGGASVNTSGSQSGTHTGHFGGQDGIVLGGTALASTGAVDDMFQGYGTVIQGNSFTQLNRGVYGLTVANSVIIADNSFVHNTGTVLIEFDGSGGAAGAQSITGVIIGDNILEMDVCLYGIKLVNAKYNRLENSFYDSTGPAISCYRLEATVGYLGSAISTFNTIATIFTDGLTLVTQDLNDVQLTFTTVLGATSFDATTGYTGLITNEMYGGLLLKGKYNAALQYHSNFYAIDYSFPNKGVGLGYDGSVNTGYLDAYNLGSAIPNPIKINPRGGAVQTSASQRTTKTAGYTVTVADSSTQFDNTGAGAQVIFTLPSDPPTGSIYGGVTYGFAVVTAQNVRVLCGHASAKISDSGVEGSAGGYIECATAGTYLVLEQVDTANGRKWFVKSKTGTWTLS